MGIGVQFLQLHASVSFDDDCKMLVIDHQGCDRQEAITWQLIQNSRATSSEVCIRAYLVEEFRGISPTLSTSENEPCIDEPHRDSSTLQGR